MPASAPTPYRPTGERAALRALPDDEPTNPQFGIATSKALHQETGATNKLAEPLGSVPTRLDSIRKTLSGGFLAPSSTRVAPPSTQPEYHETEISAALPLTLPSLPQVQPPPPEEKRLQLPPTPAIPTTADQPEVLKLPPLTVYEAPTLPPPPPTLRQRFSKWWNESSPFATKKTTEPEQKTTPSVSRPTKTGWLGVALAGAMGLFASLSNKSTPDTTATSAPITRISPKKDSTPKATAATPETTELSTSASVHQGLNRKNITNASIERGLGAALHNSAGQALLASIYPNMALTGNQLTYLANNISHRIQSKITTLHTRTNQENITINHSGTNENGEHLFMLSLDGGDMEVVAVSVPSIANVSAHTRTPEPRPVITNDTTKPVTVAASEVTTPSRTILDSTSQQTILNALNTLAHTVDPTDHLTFEGGNNNITIRVRTDNGVEMTVPFDNLQIDPSGNIMSTRGLLRDAIVDSLRRTDRFKRYANQFGFAVGNNTPSAEQQNPTINDALDALQKADRQPQQRVTPAPTPPTPTPSQTQAQTALNELARADQIRATWAKTRAEWEERLETSRANTRKALQNNRREQV